MRLETAAERVYILSLGSQQGNRHIPPLPPGVPFEEKQLAALSIERGVIGLSEDDFIVLAHRLREWLELN